MNTKKIAWLGFVIWMLMLCAVLYFGREWVVRTYDTSTERANWSEFRAVVQEEVDANASGDPISPVARRVPKSSEPPALILMRDYFAICLVGTMLFGGLIYWVTVILFAGAMKKQPTYE